MPATNLTLFSKIRYYRQMSQEIQAHLSKFPDDWSKFQKIFNLSADRVYDDIREFERDSKDESKIYKLKKIFENRYRKFFLCGEYIKWSYEKPFGYAGDFKIIDSMYQNSPRTNGFDRLWDNWFQQLSAPRAVRERKEDFKKIILDFVEKCQGKDVRIMNLASGPAREIKELLETDKDNIFSKVIFDCYELDINAIDYARQLLNNAKNVNFIQKNAIRIALKKNIKDEISQNYDLIYSTGLFDYLDERVATRLVINLKKLLTQNGMMIIANANDKYSNPSAGWMEWVADWYLIYRTGEEFKKIFIDAGFSAHDLQVMPQKSKVMQYCFAR